MMSDDSTHSAASLDEQLVAYLDGELDAEGRRRIEEIACLRCPGPPPPATDGADVGSPGRVGCRSAGEPVYADHAGNGGGGGQPGRPAKPGRGPAAAAGGGFWPG